MKKRKRRTAGEIQKIRDHLLRSVDREGKITLSRLIGDHGPAVGIKDTPSDKNLVKRQLDLLADNKQIRFSRQGRDLVAQSTARSASSREAASSLAASSPRESGTDLDVLRAFARQLEEFTRTLQDQISTLVRMIEKAAE